MRGEVKKQASMWSTVSPEKRVPQEHPIRRIKAIADAQLAELSSVFDEMYGNSGRPSIPPETLLKSCLLIALFSVRSERQFCERLDYDLMFRWFLDMSLDDESFDASTFAKNKERLLEADVARLFFEHVVCSAKAAQLVSAEHFTVDGTLIEAWASLKSFRPRGEKDKKPPDDPGNPSVDFHGEKRSNDTHESKTDPEAKLARKGHSVAAKLSYAAHVLMENRNGLCTEVKVTTATGDAEWTAAKTMIESAQKNGIFPSTIGADKGYDVQRFIDDMRSLGVTPHVAQNIKRNGGSRIDARTTRHPGYEISQRCRKKVEEIFGWMKSVAGWRKTRYRGSTRNALWAYLVAAAYNLIRMAKLLPA